jgi:diguanylate cyclase (GGDEF)-like protein
MPFGESNSHGAQGSQPPESLGTAPNRVAKPSKEQENRRVLAVDDEAHVTDGLRCNLRAKFTLVTASSGVEALEVLERLGPFAVVMSDLRMPGMDGIELLRRIREKYPDTVRIMLSGNADMAATVQAVNSGGIHHLLLKPTPVEEIRQVLDRACADFNRQAREQALALEDPLLGIGSRRALERAMPRVHSHAVRHDRTYALAMIDVDHFKRYNDHYGHLAGDQALRGVAQVISSACRASDEVFRYGGEEILLLLPDTDEHSATEACERIRAKVQELGIAHAGNPTGCVSISLGVASSSPEDRPELPELIERADRALYRAKEDGRNRVVAWLSVCELTETSSDS